MSHVNKTGNLLEFIDFSSNSIGCKGILKFIQSKPMMPKLCIFNLTNNNIGNCNLEPFLEFVNACKLLHSLDLSRNKLSDKCVPHIVNLIKTNSNLSKLSISGNYT